MADMEIVHLPKETVSDDRYLILSVSSSGTKVSKNDVILEFQTSKATMELVSPAAGYFHTWVEAGQQLAVGAALGVISPKSAAPEEELARLKRENAGTVDLLAGDEASDVRFSKPAEALIAKHGLKREQFAGLKLVRREDVERVLARGAADSAQKVSVRGTASSLIILGGSGHAKICIDIIRQMKTFDIVGLLDPTLEIGAEVLGIPVIGRDSDLERFREEGVEMAVCGVGAASNHPTRTPVFEKMKKAGYRIPNIIHPSAVVEPSVEMGEGNQIMGGAIIGSDVRIGNNCIINSGAIVTHEGILGDNVHIAPGAVLGGNVTVGRDSLIGMGATVYFGLTVGSRVVIANGMNVFVPVPDRTILRH